MELLSCVALMLVLLPVVLCIVMWSKIAEVKDRLMTLERRVGDLAREQVENRIARPAGMAAEAIPGPQVGAEKRPAEAQASAAATATAGPTAAPAAAAPAEPASAEREQEWRREKLEILRSHLSGQAEAAAGAARPQPGRPAAVPPALPARVTPPAAQTAAREEAARKAGLEKFLATKVLVVLGAITLALTGILLVKYMADHDFFNRERRVVAGLTAGAALIATGQWRRRREPFLAQGLAAAGIVALFAAVFAATTLYGFISVTGGFVVLAAVTAGAVGMSLQDWRGGQGSRGGVLIATLGLIGGFMTPILVHSNTANVPGLFGYLLLLHVGMVVVTRMRGWTVLAGLSVVLSSIWLIGWILLSPWNADDATVLGGFMLASTAAMVIGTVQSPEKWRGNLAATLLTWCSAGMGLLSACLLLGRSGYSNLEWGFFAVLLAGTFALGRLRSMYEGLSWVGALVVMGMLALWGGPEHAWLAKPEALEALGRLEMWMTVLGIGSVLAAYGCQWGSAAPVRWGGLSVVLATGYFGLAYMVVGVSPRPEEWAYWALVVAALLTAMAAPVYLARSRMRTGESTLAVFGHGILALVVMAPPMALSGGALTAAWCALLPLAALAIWRLRLPGLLLGYIGLIVLAGIRGLMLLPLMHAGGDGRSLLWNPVVWTYGSMAAAMGISAWIMERCGEMPARLKALPGPKAFSTLLQAGAAVAGFVLLTLEVRWYFHQGALDEWTAYLPERGMTAAAWLLLACALVWAGETIGRRVVSICGQVAGIIGMVYCVGALILVTNPMWWGDDVGPVAVFNDLPLAYGLPALLCGLLAYLLRAKSKPAYAAVAKEAGFVGLLMALTLVSLEVRQGFQGAQLNGEQMGFVERGTYTVAWMICAGVLLGVGTWLNRAMLKRMGMVVAWATLAYSVVITAIIMSPLLWHDAVGATRIFNWLLYEYGLPAAGCAMLCVALGRGNEWEKLLSRAAGLAGLLLSVVMVTLEVQHWFRAPVRQPLGLDAGPFGEMTAYSLAWAVLGGIYLVAGIVRRSQMLRWASLVMMLVTVGKVFIFDMADLKDLERVASFAGLGISLMAIAFVYQRFVFKRVAVADGAGDKG